MSDSPAQPAALGKWWVCGLLLLALMLNYMDRQTLSQMAATIQDELKLSDAQYGGLEKGFGYAFAFGGILVGLIADRANVRWLYPCVLLGWSLAGVATGYADKIGVAIAPLIAAVAPNAIDPSDPSQCAYWGFLICRVILGLFEAGQWPCALITTQRMLSSADRPFGNSVLQSGASIGAILTPQIVNLLVTKEPGTWRLPFVVVGVVGLLWIGPWLWMTRGLDLSRRDASSGDSSSAQPTLSVGQFWLRYATLAAVVITINAPWHFFRAWMPKMLEGAYGYEKAVVGHFTSAYYIGTDIGCIAAGFAIRWLISRGQSVHGSRLLVFGGCTLLTMLSMFASFQPRGPVLLGTVLLIGFGALGLFPIYYSLTQELSTRHQGKVTGSLSFITWAVSAEMHAAIGRHIDNVNKAAGIVPDSVLALKQAANMQAYGAVLFWIGAVPLVGLIAMLMFWRSDKAKA